MKPIQFKQLLILIFMIFLMSKARHISQWFYELHRNEILTLDPIRDFPDDAKAAITVVFYILIGVIAWKLILKK